MSGMTLSVDENLVKPIVEAEIASAIVREFNKTPEIIEKITKQILTSKVDDEGKPDRYGSRNALTYIEWLCQTAVKEAAKAAVKSWVEEHKDDIEKEIKYQLSQNKAGFATGIMTGFLKAMEDRWHVSVTVSEHTREW